MRKTAKLSGLLLALVLCMAGCTPFDMQNVNDLLRAPALAQEQSDIQRALRDSLGNEEIQYKYPMEGSERSPMFLRDLDGDGRDEAIVFFSFQGSSTANADRSNACLAVLQWTDGAWRVAADVDGPQTDIASVTVADMFGDGSQQLIVGYSTATRASKTLVLYSYSDGTLYPTPISGNYSTYLLDDFTGRGGVDLAIVAPAPEAAGELLVSFYTGQNGQFERMPGTDQAIQLNANIERCVGIHPSLGREEERLLVVDGIVAGNLVSQVLVLRGSGEGFYARGDAAYFIKETLRANLRLTSRDVNEDGVVEVPVVAQTVNTLNGDKNLAFLDWLDCTGELAENEAPQSVEFGLLDGDRNVYIRLPEDWRGAVSVSDGSGKGEWRVQRTQTGASLLRVRVLKEGETPPLGGELVPGTQRAYLTIGDAVTAAERALIRMTLLG